MPTLVTKAITALTKNKLFASPELLIGARIARRANVVSVRDKGFIPAVPTWGMGAAHSRIK